MQDKQRTDNNLRVTFADGELLNPAAYIKRIVCRMCFKCRSSYFFSSS